MRIRDKVLIEGGQITKAKAKWYGIGSYAHPYLWKTNISDTDYKESWGDPRIKKEENPENRQQKKPNNPKKNRGRGM